MGVAKKLKVVFFSPSCQRLGVVDKEPWAPIGAMSIASYLEERGLAVCAIYLKRDYTPVAVKEYLDRERPDVIGLTCFTYNRFSCIELALMAKHSNPDVLVIFGGPHATFMDEQMLMAYPFIDVIVRGEGEETMGELLEGGGRALSGIQGVSFHRGIKVVRNAERARLATLNTLPLINYKKWDVCAPYRGRAAFSAHRYLPIETSRGCLGRCSFCITPKIWGGKVAFRDVDKACSQTVAAEACFSGHELFNGQKICPGPLSGHDQKSAGYQMVLSDKDRFGRQGNADVDAEGELFYGDLWC